MELSTETLNSKWVKTEIISQGAFGIVYKGYDSSNHQVIAIKKMKTPTDEDGIQVEPLREVIILRSINHPNIVKYIITNYLVFSMSSVRRIKCLLYSNTCRWTCLVTSVPSLQVYRWMRLGIS
jgi:serine/threonine protein kinase